MSKETLSHLNTQTLIGYTEKRGTAWHYRAEEQGTESNHYPGPIPVEDVRRRLFDWQAVEGTVESTYWNAALDAPVQVTDPTRKTILRVQPDRPATILGIFSRKYQIHDYDEWLITNVENLLDSGLAVGSAGLLKGGAQAWVQVEMADTLKVADVEFRPFLTAATSMDGTLATDYVRGAQVVRCDNSLAVALNANSRIQFKTKHSANSLGRISDVRAALDIVFETGDAISDEIDRLTSMTVTDADLEKFLNEWAPLRTETPRSTSMTNRKQVAMRDLWTDDPRVSPWKGTAYGVLSMVNTYGHHIQPVRNVSRAERNAANVITGARAKEDQAALRVLAEVMF
jgi:phage/plasmid-like protein (TIGR03299 family)